MKSFILSAAIFTSLASAQSPLYGQCGGQGWNGPTTCAAASVCTYQNPYYSQCLPASSTVTGLTTTLMTTTRTSTSSLTTSTSSSNSGAVKYAGVNIAGFDFGCDSGNTGTCDAAKAYPPLTQYYGNDGPGQMSHFVKDDHLNVFRLPVTWQFLVNNNLGGSLDATNFGKYDTLVQACLATGATCIIDIHNYARWNNQIIGQGGPTNAQFANIWSQLASTYKSQTKIIFGIMNEPHDLNIGTWAASVQAVVTAIRQAGATSQMILLPGSDFSSAQLFVSDGSFDALSAVKNPDGSITNLIFDIHKYLDTDNRGSSTECITNNIADAFAPLANTLRNAKRQALLTETGGGNTASCQTYLCQQIAYLNQNSDVYLGYIGWAAGNFASDYALSETPTLQGNTWVDQSLVTACIRR